jgi:hypothetical protein
MIPSAVSGNSHQLLDLIQKLEDRVAQLESILVQRGSTLRLQIGGSYIELTPDSIWIESKVIAAYTETSIRLDAHDIALNSSQQVSIKAGGDLVLKGARIQQN